MTLSLIDTINQEIAEYRVLVDTRDKALALNNNPGFKELILDGFCTEKCAEYARQSVSRALSVEDREHALALAQSAGYFLDYMNVIVAMGNQAEQNIGRLEEELKEACMDSGE